MNYWWIGIAIIAAFNVGFIVGLFWGAKQRDDYDPVENDELPRVMPRIQYDLDKQVKPDWELRGLDR